jgi:hypothetical protein
MKIEYDTPIEVTKEQYHLVMTEASGIVAGRIDNGKYYIKVWMMSYANYVVKLLSL